MTMISPFALRFFPLIFGLIIFSGNAFGQSNFSPLKQGEYTEEQEKLIVLKGLDVSGEYVGALVDDRYTEIPAQEGDTRNIQDFRLKLKSVLHRNLAMHMVLSAGSLDPTWETSREIQNDTFPSDALPIMARQAYLRYSFNPRSALISGLHPVTMGDEKGKVLSGIYPGITYDCKVGTWCMPFGAVRLGPAVSDWLYHWGLGYTAWDDKKVWDRSALDVKIYRIIYKENNVPLGTNRGPAKYDPANPTTPGTDQQTDNKGAPIFYDTQEQEYFGIKVNWEASSWFVNFDWTSNQGRRVYHNWDKLQSLEFFNPADASVVSELESNITLSGVAWETEFGYRTPKSKMGFRLMSADGDPVLESGDTLSLKNDIAGYFEVKPGTYQGARLFFNGLRTMAGTGDGMGHSINNTKLVGFFYDYKSPKESRMRYSLGIYKLDYNHPIYDINGELQSDIGYEVDNLLAFYLKESLALEFEVNMIKPGKAFRMDDYSTPTGNTKRYSQYATRLIYQF